MLSQYSFFATAHSANRKTGDIAQVYTSSNSCPIRCPFLNSGCYGKNFGTNFQWRKADNGVLDIDGLRMFAAGLESGTMVRHNVAGDLSFPGTSRINPALVDELISIYAPYRAYTYTHCAIDDESAAVIRKANACGFVINVSCETMGEVDDAMARGLPAVLAVTKAPEKGAKTPCGHRLILCPAQDPQYDGKGVNCANCQLCTRGQRTVVICFDAHGSRAKAAREAIEQKIHFAKKGC